MALINSIALGKASGKLGNVIFQSYQKKTVARQKNSTISTEPSDLQLKQQRAFLNNVRAFTYLEPFLQFWKPRDFPLLNKYQAFIKFTNSFYSRSIPTKGFLAVRALRNQSFGKVTTTELLKLELDEVVDNIASIKVSLKYLLSQPENEMLLCVLCQQVDNPEDPFPAIKTVYRNVEVRIEDWDRGFCLVEFDDINPNFIIAYTYNFGTFSDNLIFSEIIIN